MVNTAGGCVDTAVSDTGFGFVFWLPPVSDTEVSDTGLGVVFYFI